jgi:hypothetical protein
MCVSVDYILVLGDETLESSRSNPKAPMQGISST